MRTLVLGASGYLGGRVAAALAESGHSVVGQVRTPPDYAEAWRDKLSAIVVGDLRDDRTLDQLVEARPDVAVGFVSLNHKQSAEGVDDALAVNVGATWRVLDRLARASLERFVYFSTQQVYGKFGAERITEDRPARPLNAYGLTHLMTEDACDFVSRTHATRCVSVRLSNGCGAPAFPSADCWWLAVNDLCRTALSRSEVRLLSDGTPQRDFVHVLDVADAARLLLELPAATLAHGRYNLGSGRTATLLEIAHQVAGAYGARTGRAAPVLLPDGSVSTSAEAHASLPRFTYDVSRLTELGWRPRRTVSAAIDEVFDFLGPPP